MPHFTAVWWEKSSMGSPSRELRVRTTTWAVVLASRSRSIVLSRAWLLASMTPARSTTYWLVFAGRGGVTAQARVGQAQNNRIIRSFLELGDLNAIHHLGQSFRGSIKVLEQP